MTRTTFHRRLGLSLVEVLVSMAIIAVLLSLIWPVIKIAREYSRQSQCASHLHAVGLAFSAYAAQNNDYYPRYGRYNHVPGPNWLIALGKQQGLPPGSTWETLRAMRMFHCESHPTDGAAAAFVVNASSLTSEAENRPEGPIRQSSIRSASRWPFVLEASDKFNTGNEATIFDDIFFEVQLVFWKPIQLPPSEKARITVARHRGKRSNVLYGDLHVDTIDRVPLFSEFVPR
jgi:prepilin-type N-terminal cleavage/methylation domain-containing protein/prepilin-type processing-associated H-X9-DG protein